MSHPDIGLDAQSVGEDTRRHSRSTKREAVDPTLRATVGPNRTEELLALRGVGWDGDLGEMRADLRPG
ncbi:hypothetical protein [Actinoalloteichus hymeniacidonis]|nr:hypothetical protein [Actinoalloteichus hymeniacidonis]MBB5906566.1 Arc/MetJ family transcription regulator [Actinoalloteichus hymeniacidonis]